ncbi:hypothetical protein NMY22_g11518 [Coprinellus aureogranulatus]|nr:hypothetical protein NMY22_g11518 [Coprinellus aureogranulatus]
MSDGRIAVIEPTRTRKIQIVMCFSIVSSLVILRCIPSEDLSPAGYVSPPTALLTLPHHLTIIIMAFMQRRKLYTPEEIPYLVPVTAKLWVVFTSWTLCCFWLVTSLFYLMDLSTTRHKTLFTLTAVEAALVFSMSVMASRERLELLERQADQPTSLMFVVDESGQPATMEGP